jgi:diguanylate cyclase (GGDEF)-like protein
MAGVAPLRRRRRRAWSLARLAWRRTRGWHTNLQARVSLHIAALLIVIMMLTVGVADYGLRLYASSVAEQGLAAGAGVLDRNLAARQEEMRAQAEVVARDFGFREAFALGDRKTLGSALASLADRTGAPVALVVGLDGTVTASPGSPRVDGQALLPALNKGESGGLIVTGRALSLAVAARIEMPDLAGWLVIARPLGQRDMAELAGLSGQPVDAQVTERVHLDRALAGFAPGTINHFDGPGGDELVRLSALPSLDAGLQPQLVLRYQLANATRAYRSLRVALASIAMVAVAMGVFLGSRLARGILQPLSRLAAATAAMSRGEMVRVSPHGRDELASLARSFNTMVDAIEERERRITHAWLHDGLTNLPNRRFFQEKLDRALARENGDRRLLVALLDLDDFKLINDTMGHEAGDAMLLQFAALLQKTMPEATIARLGSDEFGVMLEDIDPARDLAALVDDFAQKLAIEVAIAGQMVPLSAGFGVAVYPDDARDSGTLLTHAELALSRAKADGKRVYHFFEATLDEEASHRRKLEIDLRHAVRKGEFELHFQPLFCPAEECVKGFEALLRWDHPQRGRVSPAEFIPIAEASGLIIPISEWVLREACRQAAGWGEPIAVAVNISANHFRVPGLVACVVSALSQSGLAPHRLELEITEGVFITNFDSTLDTLRQLRALGVRIALDDFGTGYSSLSYLRAFPFDKVKIDQSFVRDLSTDASARAVVRAITALADALGMETLAEGVEDSEQYDALIAEGCSMIQGYLISRPVPGTEVAAILARLGGSVEHRQVGRSA